MFIHGRGRWLLRPDYVLLSITTVHGIYILWAGIVPFEKTRKISTVVFKYEVSVCMDTSCLLPYISRKTVQAWLKIKSEGRNSKHFCLLWYFIHITNFDVVILSEWNKDAQWFSCLRNLIPALNFLSSSWFCFKAVI